MVHACVVRFLEKGANVLIVDLSNPDPKFLDKHAEKVQYCAADVCNELELKNGITLGLTRFNTPLVAAVTCAGILHSERTVGRAGAASLDAFRRVIEINLIGTFNTVRLCAEAMAQNVAEPPNIENGVIVMTSSIAAFDGQIGQAGYAASKGGVAAMTLPLARDLGRMGIRVVSIAPGVFETPMMKSAPEKVRNALLEQSIFPARFGDPAEFAATVMHTIENSMFNGCTLRLDAGMRMPSK